jgi:hypothetical protein
MSYQIPDILASARGFELEINPHCRAITRASETWCLECLESNDITLISSAHTSNSQAKPSATPTQPIKKTLSELKPGLLASMCYPACDYPQLRLMTDLFTLLVLDNGRRLADLEDPLVREWVLFLNFYFPLPISLPLPMSLAGSPLAENPEVVMYCEFE